MSIFSKKTTRRTSSKKITAKIKPSKTKRKRSTTSVLNSHKKIKKKIKLPSLKRKKKDKGGGGTLASILDTTVNAVSSGIEAATPIPKESNGQGQDTASGQDQSYVRREGDPDPGSKLAEEKTLEDVAVRSGKRKKKKDNTMLYIAIAIVALVAFLYMRKKK